MCKHSARLLETDFIQIQKSERRAGIYFLTFSFVRKKKKKSFPTQFEEKISIFHLHRFRRDSEQELRSSGSDVIVYFKAVIKNCISVTV